MLLLLLQPLSLWSGAATLAMLTLWALRDSRSSIQALSVGVIVTFANHAFVPHQPMVPLFKWLLLFAVLVRVSLDARYRPTAPPNWTWSFALFIFISLTFAFLVSHDRTLSLLKLFSFSVGAAACLLVFRDRRLDKEYFSSWFYTLHFAVLALSLPLLFTSAGYAVNKIGFQGILSQPQAYGVYLAPMTAYITALVVTGCSSFTLIAIDICSWFTIIASGCRTAVLACGVAFLVTFCMSLVFPRVRRLMKPLAVAGFAALVILTGIWLLATRNDTWIQRFDQFVSKGEVQGDRSWQSLWLGSRGRQMSELLELVEAHPLTGVGFGLDGENGSRTDEKETVLGVPLTASTEQGFIYLAVPVQVGLVGGVIFSMLLISLFEPIFASDSFPILVAALTGLLINNGEMIILAIGGLGLQLWLLLAWAHESCITHSTRARHTLYLNKHARPLSLRVHRRYRVPARI
jgi:hypothetical protein